MSVLDVHPANEEERLAAFRNVHEMWGRGLSLEEHVRRRLTSPQHNFARWYVGTVNGEVVTSLGAYPLEFYVRGEVVRGFAIGAVHTVPSARGRGYAPRLIAEVERQLRADGRLLSVLFSDIDPDYYARLGYLVCPSWSGTRQVRPDGGTETDGWRLDLAKLEDRERMEAEYARCHRDLTLAVHRGREYWNYVWAKFPEDLAYWILDGAGETVGYVRLGRDEATLRILDVALLSDRTDAWVGFSRSVVAHAETTGAAKVYGWLPRHAGTKAFFKLESRATEITMFKSLDADLELDAQMLAAVEHLREVDHV